MKKHNNLTNSDVITRLNGIQSSIQRLAHGISSSSEIATGQDEDMSFLEKNIEKRKAITALLLLQIRVVERLVRVQARSTPIRLRKYDTELVSSLVLQIENLLDILSSHVLPLLEQTDSNRY